MRSCALAAGGMSFSEALTCRGALLLRIPAESTTADVDDDDDDDDDNDDKRLPESNPIADVDADDASPTGRADGVTERPADDAGRCCGREDEAVDGREDDELDEGGR
jgi:hypothetical protein